MPKRTTKSKATTRQTPRSSEPTSGVQPIVVSEEGYPTELVAALYNTPLLLEKGRADSLFASLNHATRGGDPAPEAFGFYFYDRYRDDDFTRIDGIAVIEVNGGLFKWRLARIRKQIERARSEAGIRAILLNVDSAGGTVTDTFDLADLIFETRARMPVYAIANDNAFSAAYALASSAERVSLPRTGGVGSVGVIATHVEFSEMDRRIGVKYTTLTSGERKGDYIDTEPLNDTARNNLQAEIDRLRVIFVNTVARNRGMGADAVFATEAGVFYAETALDVGFADAVETYAQTLDALRARLKPAGNRVGASSTGAIMATLTEEQKQFLAACNEQNIKEAEERGRQAALAATTPTTVTTEGDGAISLDAARSQSEQAAVSARNAEREAHQKRVAEVKDICTLAGCPQRAIDFIEKGVSIEDIRKTLMDEAASRDAATDVSGQHAGATGGQPVQIDRNAIYQSRASVATPSAKERRVWDQASPSN